MENTIEIEIKTLKETITAFNQMSRTYKSWGSDSHEDYLQCNREIYKYKKELKLLEIKILSTTELNLSVNIKKFGVKNIEQEKQRRLASKIYAF